MSGCLHTQFIKGQRIIIHFRDGKKEIDKYIGKKSGVIITQNLGRVKTSKIRQVGIYK